MIVKAKDLRPGDVVELLRDNIGRVDKVEEISAADLCPDWKGPKTYAAPLIRLEIKSRVSVRMPCGYPDHYLTECVEPDAKVAVRKRKE